MSTQLRFMDAVEKRLKTKLKGEAVRCCFWDVAPW